MESLDHIFSTLAEPVRREIVELLRYQPMRAGELGNILSMSPPALSRHLRMLRQHGLVEEQPDAEDARARIYRLKPEPFQQLQEWLEEVASYWTEQLQSFKELAEKKHRKKK